MCLLDMLHVNGPHHLLQRFAKRLAPLRFSSSRRSIATMGEPARSIRCRYSSKGILKSFLQSLTGSRSDATQDCLHLRKSLFNGRKIWRISRQKQQLTASSFDELPHLFSSSFLSLAWRTFFSVRAKDASW